ncbi:hydroxyacid dehydrogenase [Collinsella sp. zg1085]|uniref:2-hydroxyacid dehydrogenase n=1 Tax=Collinsella sp. zg1085 TaxID=2844380 RepID=UPI001C0C4C9D|nr:2-hydroxyacid dehydrogenase [Collinsella sp. zg1085]QWT17963.1 hydroxyacid dehydrogenase [Collinsella sp. zg1085]
MHICLLEPLGIDSTILHELSQPLIDAGHSFVAAHDKSSNPDELIRRAQGADVIMIANNPLPGEVIRALPQLKLIAVAFTGIDHVDVSACRERGIAVSNCAGYSDTAVAELSVGLAIDVFRLVAAGHAAVHTGGNSTGMVGREIAGKTVGIVGTGHIGTQTGKLFAAFGAHVLGYARHENPQATAFGIQHVNLETLLEQSDIVSLHLPLNETTRKSFGEEHFARMKESAIFINCARGAIVDNDALAVALNTEQIAGAGIDVFDMEPPIPADYPLLSAKNTIFTPHVAYLTQEAMIRRAHIEFENVAAWLAGTPQNLCEI